MAVIVSLDAITNHITGNGLVKLGTVPKRMKKGKPMDKNSKFGQGVKFERIRRITGYLVGSLDRWNNAKKAEERDRVKHSCANEERKE